MQNLCLVCDLPLLVSRFPGMNFRVKNFPKRLSGGGSTGKDSADRVMLCGGRDVTND